jgi:signal transduction histidine kinase
MKRWDVVAAALAALAVVETGIQLVIATRLLPDRIFEFLVLIVAASPAIVLGVIVARRTPTNVVGALLTLVGVGPFTASTLEGWYATAKSSAPFVGAAAIGPIAEGAWTIHYLGPIAIALVFPTGRLLSPIWRIAAAACVVIPIGFIAVIAIAPTEEIGDLLSAPLLIGLLALLVFSVIAVVKRYRRSADEERRQIRWLAASAILAPAALIVCWIGALLWNRFDLVGAVLAALVVAISVSVAVAMLRHRLYGFDRLLAGTVRWAILVTALGVVFAAVALLLGLVAGGASPVVAAAATLAVALAFLPLQRVIRRWIDARFQPRRERLRAAVREFTLAVRDGRAAPEELEAVLQKAGGTGITVQITADAAAARILATGDSGLTAADIRDLESEARLPLELARLRGDLRSALEQTDASRARLVAAADDERRRIQRNLHDGAQSNLVALGMRLREMQRGGAANRTDEELGEAVELVQRTITDLRALAQGVRPSSLDEGLEPALRAMVKSVPLRIDLDLDPAPVSEPSATAAYYVAAEAVTNALKHANPGRIGISLGRTSVGLRLAIQDDGAGTASEAVGSGLAGIRDRVEAVGGRLHVSSGAGAGTLVEAIFL